MCYPSLVRCSIFSAQAPLLSDTGRVQNAFADRKAVFAGPIAAASVLASWIRKLLLSGKTRRRALPGTRHRASSARIESASEEEPRAPLQWRG